MFHKLCIILLIFTGYQSISAINYEYKRVLNGNSTTIEMPSLFPPFDVQFNQIHVLNIPNNGFYINDKSDPMPFILIGYELYRLTEKSLQAIAVFTDTGSQPIEQTTFNYNIIDVQAYQWDNKLIFVVNILDVYNVYLLKVPPSNKNEPLIVLSPIQKIKKHGQSQFTMLFDLNNRVYCLLASNYLDEHRSELRVLEWKHSFFQAIVTLANKNHKIDRMLVEQSKNLIILIDNKVAESHDTIVHVYNYNHRSNDADSELDVQRIQMLSTQIDLILGNAFTYNSDSILYMIFCGVNLPHAIISRHCEYYNWRTDAIADATVFQRMDHLPLLENLPLNKMQLPIEKLLPDEQRVLAYDDVLAFQVNDMVTVVDDKTDSDQSSFMISCGIHNLLDIFVLKTKSLSKNKFHLKLMCLHACFESAECKGITLTVTSHLLFEKYAYPKSKNSTSNRIKAHLFDTKEKIITKLHHIRNVLTDQRNHLISDQEEYLNGMHIKEDNLKKILYIIKVLRDGAPINGIVQATKVKFNPNSKNTVGTVALNSVSTEMNHNITTLCQHLKTVNENLKSKLAKQRYIHKRSLSEDGHWSGQTLRVKRLYLNSEQHPFQGMATKIKGNYSIDYYRLNGNIKTNYLTIGALFEMERKRKKRSEIQSLSSDTKITVRTINGIDWDTFLGSLYRKGVNTQIIGKLRITNPAKTSEISANIINGVPATDLMTLATDQQSDSNFFVSKLMSRGLDARVINNMKDFANTVALQGNDNTFKSRIKITELNVRDKLQLADAEGENMTEHIIGTQPKDLMQIYSGQVTITGSLTLSNVIVSSIRDNFFSQPIHIDLNPNDNTNFMPTTEEAVIVVSGTPFALEKVTQEFWMKSADQNIGDVNFVQPLSTPQITANFLNGHPVLDYFIFDDRIETFNANIAPLSVTFENDVEILGNINTNQKSILRQMSAEAIPSLGNARVTFTSPLTFKDRLIVNHITMQTITDDFVRKSTLQPNEPGKSNLGIMFGNGVQKSFNNKLLIDENIIFLNRNETKIKISNLNNVHNLTERFKSIIVYEQSIEQIITFDGNFTADALNVGVFIDNTKQLQQQYDINAILSNIFSFHENRIHSFKVNGNISFDRADIRLLNSIKLDKYLSGIVLNENDGQPIQIGGEKTFISDLNTMSTTVKLFNEKISPSDWIANAFRQQRTEITQDQVITSPNWQFGNLITDNLQVERTINDVRIDPKGKDSINIIVVDDNPENVITIKSDVSFGNEMKIGSDAQLKTAQMRPCNVNELFGDTINLPQKYWRDMTIIGNVKILSADVNGAGPARGSLSDFFENAILADAEQTINSSVTFKCNPGEEFIFNRIATETLNSNESLTLINGIDLVKVYNDAVTKTIISLDGQTQSTVIRGGKNFKKANIICYGNETITTGDLFVKTVNDVNIHELNATMIYRNTPEIHIVAGQKLLFLRAPTVQTLTIGNNQTINGIHMDDLFFVYSPRQNQSSPSISFERADQMTPVYRIHSNDNLELNFINNMSLAFFLENRVKLFDVSGKASMNKPQMIDGFLTFENLYLNGEKTQIEQINDILCNDIVLSQSNDKQQITGFKEIVGPQSALYINRPFHTWKINEIEFVSTFSKSILLNEKQTFNQLKIEYPYQSIPHRGITIRKVFNGMTIQNDVRFSDEMAQYNLGAALLNVTTMEKQFFKLNYIGTTNTFNITFDPTLNTDLKTFSLPIDSFYAENSTEETSLCPVQYHIHSPRQPGNEILITRTEVNQRILKLFFGMNFTIQISTVFPPLIKYYRNCKVSPTVDSRSVVYVNYEKIITLRNSIVESVHAFNAGKRIYIVLHIFDKGAFIYTQNDNGTWSMDSHIPFMNSFMYTVKMLRWKSSNILVVATTNRDLVHKKPSTKLYLFNEMEKRFLQIDDIAGEFNIIGGVSIPDVDGGLADLYLILALQGKPYMNLYKAILSAENGMVEKFQSAQMLKLKQRVKTMSIFCEHAICYITIISESGEFHVYQHLPNHTKQHSSWINITSNAWHLKTSGYWKNGRAMIPLFIKQKLYLFMITDEIQYMNNRCALSDKICDTSKIATMFTLNYY